jgi:hypothetical protein
VTATVEVEVEVDDPPYLVEIPFGSSEASGDPFSFRFIDELPFLGLLPPLQLSLVTEADFDEDDEAADTNCDGDGDCAEPIRAPPSVNTSPLLMTALPPSTPSPPPPLINV